MKKNDTTLRKVGKILDRHPLIIYFGRQSKSSFSIFDKKNVKSLLIGSYLHSSLCWTTIHEHFYYNLIPGLCHISQKLESDVW